MKVLNTVHTIELTTKEIELITTALHGQYKTERDLYMKDNDSKAYCGKYYDAMNEVRDLRNVFAKITGRVYMGEDA